MTQTLALLLDAYRELNAKKLFWITLILSGGVMLVFAFLGIDGSHLTFAGMRLNVDDAPYRYKWIFSWFAVGAWLTWIGVALALFSTAGIFPDLLTSGTIDLYLSKPLSRLRFFLTKYLTGLLFVALQVGIFSVVSFLVFGFRVGVWNLSIFLAIPLVVCMFSYLFGFCVFLGVWTRSTIAAILLTLLLWFVCFGVQYLDGKLLEAEVLFHLQVDNDRMIVGMKSPDGGEATSSMNPAFASTLRQSQRKAAEERLPDLEKALDRIQMFHRITSNIKTVVPKTTETTDMLDRYLFSDDEASGTARQRTRGRNSNAPFGENDVEAAKSKTAGIVRSESPWYIIGTSLLAEAVVVALGAWIFCRRDY